MGKIREKSGNFTKTCQGNIREFSVIYILIVSPFSRIYIYNIYIYVRVETVIW